MFPHTDDIHTVVSGHVETAVLLYRKSEAVDKHITVEYYPEGRHKRDGCFRKE